MEDTGRGLGGGVTGGQLFKGSVLDSGKFSQTC
jgi:hypothetical protein